MAELFRRMLMDSDYRFACASIGNARHIRILRDDRIDCFVLGRKSNSRDFSDLVKEWKPDIIHIHGTEES